jgi:hypothetical protein
MHGNIILLYLICSASVLFTACKTLQGKLENVQYKSLTLNDIHSNIKEVLFSNTSNYAIHYNLSCYVALKVLTEIC